MASTPKLAHVVLQTSNPEGLRDWYCTVLQAHVVYEGHGLSFLTFDEEHHRIALIAPPAQLTPKLPTSVGMHHTAYTFDTLEDLLDRHDELEKAGITPFVTIQHGVTTSLYYQDPDTNFVELQIDNFQTPEQATAYMEGPEYDNDPVGNSFDPAKMRAALAAGTDVKTLITRQWADESSPDLPHPLTVMT